VAYPALSALSAIHWFKLLPFWRAPTSPGCFMNRFLETAKMGVPPGNRRVLVPRRTRTLLRRGQYPRTPERTAISAVAAGRSCRMRVR